MSINRKKLKSFGASNYLVQKLTKTLKPVNKRGRLNEYDAEQVFNSIHHLMNAPKVRKTTKAVLVQLEIKVSNLLENTTTDEKLLEAIQRVDEANARFEQVAHQAQRISQEFKTYKKKCGLDFSPKNNIIVFNT